MKFFPESFSDGSMATYLSLLGDGVVHFDRVVLAKMRAGSVRSEWRKPQLNY